MDKVALDLSCTFEPLGGFVRGRGSLSRVAARVVPAPSTPRLVVAQLNVEAKVRAAVLSVRSSVQSWSSPGPVLSPTTTPSLFPVVTILTPTPVGS